MNNFANLKVIQVLYKALLTGQIIFLGVAIFVRSRGLIAGVGPDISRILQVVAVLFAFTGIWFGLWYYRKRIAIIRDMNAPVDEKLKLYQAASIVKWALTEGPCLLCAAGYLLTGNWSFIALGAIVLFVFAGYNPQKSLVARELGLGEDELS